MNDYQLPAKIHDNLSLLVIHLETQELFFDSCWIAQTLIHLFLNTSNIIHCNLELAYEFKLSLVLVTISREPLKQ